MYSINDRFTFDCLFKELLMTGHSYEEAKDYLVNIYSLSALVFQERIENDFYKKILPDKDSDDLIELKNRVFNESFLNKN